MIQNFTCILTEKKHLAGEVWFFKFSLPPGTKLEFKTGQYMILKVGDARRLYSISSPEYMIDAFELTVGIIPGGLASTYLEKMEVGQTAEFQGPAGFFTLRSTDKPKVFLDTGTGIAPTRSQLLTLLQNPSQPAPTAPLYLYWGMPTRQQLYYADEFMQLARSHGNLQVRFCYDFEKSMDGLDPQYAELGRVDEVMQRHLGTTLPQEAITDYEFYLCSRKAIVDSLVMFLLGLGVAKERIHFDKFT